MQEKKVTIGIDVKGKNFNHKARHAISDLKRGIQKHFRSTNFAISPAINELIYGKGRSNTPSKVSIVGVEKDAKVFLFLDTPEDLKRKEELFAKKEAKPKVEKVAEKVEEKKVEVKDVKAEKKVKEVKETKTEEVKKE